MNDTKLTTPILFLIFNRPETTQIVFNEIKLAQPKRLFIAADGPRNDHPDDIELCQKTRNIIQQIDWKCDISTLFREENLGCKYAVSSAIDWFFSHVEEGIILEDDCVPDQSFFPFCQYLLERYHNDNRIMMISGMNYLFNKIEMEESYYFSRYYPIWGWATWKRAWSYYDIEMAEWPCFNSQKLLSHIYCHTKIVGFLKNMFQQTFSNQINTWDIQWAFSCILNNGLAICPKYNLISNIGVTGFHANNLGRFHFMPIKKINVNNLSHPNHVMPNYPLDKVCFDEITKNSSLKGQLIRLFNLISGQK